MMLLALSACVLCFVVGLLLGSWLRGEADARRYGGLLEIPPFVYQPGQQTRTVGPRDGEAA